MLRVKALLTVGRVSNLPTVWTNVLAAAILARASMLSPALTGSSGEIIFAGGEQNASWLWLGTLIALSCMYLGGMFLNDAFDAHWDKAHNNLRPIVRGEISAQTVWFIGWLLLLFGVFTIAYIYHQLITESAQVAPYQQYYGLLGASLLALAIIAYNVWHKVFTHSAFIMGACRLGVYLIAALLLAQLTLKVTLAAMSLLLYIAGLTYLARYEHNNRLASRWPLLLLFTPVIIASLSGYHSTYYWLFLLGFLAWVLSRLRYLAETKAGNEKSNVKACIGGLLAAIPLLDGLMLASVNAVLPSLLCLLVFLLIPGLHRWISGT